MDEEGAEAALASRGDPQLEDSATAVQGACVTCKSKKLKCDIASHSCNNCRRMGIQCMTQDIASGELYSRRYVDDLRDKAERLKRLLSSARPFEQGEANEPSPPVDHASHPSNVPSNHYSGSGSIFSLGQLVAAALSRGSDNFVLRLDTFMGQVRQQVSNNRVTQVSLPSLSHAVDLVQSYLNALHVTMPFMRQKDIFRQLERLYTRTPAYTGDEETQDLFQLHMLFAIGAMRSPERWEEDFARDHYMTAMGKETHLRNLDAFSEVQNLLLIFVFATLHDVGIASTWEIIRQAMRTCVRHGFHSQEMIEEDTLREQLRRRIFWSAYISDRHCSQNLGRPVALSESDVSIPLPYNKNDEDIEQSKPESVGSYTEVTTLVRHTLLRRLGTNARAALNSLSRQEGSLAESTEAVNTWIGLLGAWYESSTVKPTPVNAYETKEYLDINYHREKIKFLSYLVLPSNGYEATGSIAHLWQYTESAYQILLAYQKQRDDGLLRPNWTYVQDVLKSGFGILFCAIGIAEQRRRNSEIIGLMPSELDTLVSALKLCSKILNDITTQWHTVRRRASAFMQMSEQVFQQVTSATRNTGGEQPRLAASEEVPMDENHNLDWTIGNIDSTLDAFNTGGAPFTDAEWAELFDLDEEVMNNFSMQM